MSATIAALHPAMYSSQRKSRTLLPRFRRAFFLTAAFSSTVRPRHATPAPHYSQTNNHQANLKMTSTDQVPACCPCCLKIRPLTAYSCGHGLCAPCLIQKLRNVVNNPDGFEKITTCCGEPVTIGELQAAPRGLLRQYQCPYSAGSAGQETCGP